MVGTGWHRLLTLLLLSLALGWPILKPAMDMPDRGAAPFQASMPHGCSGCDQGQAKGASCRIVPCAVPPAIIPAIPFEQTGTKADSFVAIDERQGGRIPDTSTPPPRVSPQV
jgi:hypothetical protein